MEASLILVAVAIAVIAALIIKQKKSNKAVSPLVALNRSLGLPDNFVPPEYLGPARTEVEKVTPGGIVVNANGFACEDIVATLEGLSARVTLSGVDEIWRRIRSEAPSSQDSRYQTLTLSAPQFGHSSVILDTRMLVALQP